MDTKDSGVPINIKQLRENRGLDIKECAHAAGVSRRLYAYWETYQRLMPTTHVLILAKIFNIDPGAFIKMYSDNYTDSTL